MGWAGKAPAPDPRIGDAAMRSAEIGQQQFDWFKNWYETTGADQARREAETNQRVADSAIATMDDQRRISNEADQYNRDVFRPLERTIVADAEQFNAADYGDRKAANASAQVESAVAQAQAGFARDNARRGVAPSAGVSLALGQDAALRGAAMKAGAATSARDGAEQLGFARRMDAASLGRGLPAQSSAAAQLALSAGGTASQVTGATGDSQRANAGLMSSGFEAASRGNQAAGQILASQFATQSANANASNANRAGMLGTVLGAGAGIAGMRFFR
jgi:hypothetical protein